MATSARFYDDILILKFSGEIATEELQEAQSRISSGSSQIGTLIVVLEDLAQGKTDQLKGLKAFKAALGALGSMKVTSRAAFPARLTCPPSTMPWGSSWARKRSG